MSRSCHTQANRLQDASSLKRPDLAADTAALEQEINEHAYRLYALTPEEIKLVEER